MRSVFMRYPGGKPKALTFSYDDGNVHDRRLAGITAPPQGLALTEVFYE